MRIMGFDGRGLDRRFVVMAQPPQPGPARMPAAQAAAHGGLGVFRRGAHVAQRLHELRAAPDAPRHLLVMAKSMNFIDLAGAEVWEDELAARAMGGDLYFHRPAPRSWRCGGAPDSCNGWAKTTSFPTRRQRCTRSMPGWTARCARAVRPDLLGVSAGQPASGRLKRTHVQDGGGRKREPQKGVGEEAGTGLSKSAARPAGTRPRLCRVDHAAGASVPR